MTYSKFLILTCLFACSMCFLRKKKASSLKVNAKQELYDYANAVYTSIAEYKYNSQGIQVFQSNALFYLAQQEAFGILQNNDFGTHSRFPNWAKLAPNDYFTEITLKANIEQLPEPQEFGQVIYSINNCVLDKQPFYLSHEENYIGVAMEQLVTIPNEYTLVIQLLRKPDYYTSCKEQLFFEESNTEIIIMVNGNQFQVKCDIETDNGGWTQIQDIEVTQDKNGTVDIYDMGLEYTELLWKAKDGYAMDYNKDWSRDWDFNGFNFEINMFKMNGQWYLSQQTPQQDNVPQGAIRGSGFSEIENQVQYYNLNTDIEVLQQASQCKIRAVQHDEFCATKFIMKNLPGRIEAVSDVESLSQISSDDNTYYLNFEIYVR